MADGWHRGVFSWPDQDAFTTDAQKTPYLSAGINLIDSDVEDEVLKMAQAAKDEGDESTFCVFDVGVVVERYREWSKTFPDVQPFYAIKAYDDPVVIKLLDRLGAGFDCASKQELEMCCRLGVNPEKIIFANPIKQAAHIKYAAKYGALKMTVDTNEELDKVKELCPEARVVLRIRPLRNTDLDCAIPDFGCSLDNAPGLIRKAKLLNLNLIGVSFHVGTGCKDPEVFVRQLSMARDVFDMARYLGTDMTLLDIGGGFYGKKGADHDLYKMSGPIKVSLEANFKGVTIISEPGRYFVESALTMATCVIGKRKVDRLDQEDFHISASSFTVPNRHSTLATSFVPQPYHPKLILRNPASDKTYSYTLRGPTVAPSDIIKCEGLPEVQIGDWLMFEDVGAYTVVIGTSFNGFSTPLISRIMKRSTWDSLPWGSRPYISNIKHFQGTFSDFVIE